MLNRVYHQHRRLSLCKQFSIEFTINLDMQHITSPTYTIAMAKQKRLWTAPHLFRLVWGWDGPFGTPNIDDARVRLVMVFKIISQIAPDRFRGPAGARSVV